MDITIHASFLPHDDPEGSLAFYRDTLGFEVRNDVEYGGMHWITVGPVAAKADGESALLEKIAEMPEADRVPAERVHAIVTESAPALSPKAWYGMPAYAKDGKVAFFFRSADKFKERYAMFGFNDGANLDDGAMWRSRSR